MTTAGGGEIDAPLVAVFAPSGTLRAAINLGNPILAHRDQTTGEVGGVSVDLAHEFARRLGTDVELVVFEKASASVEAVQEERADIGFFAIDPTREGLLFSAPYVLIEGSYLVRDESEVHENVDVDRPGVRVSVGVGAVYDLYLTRALQHAEIVRCAGAEPALAALRSGDVEVAAGIRQVLEGEAHAAPGLRLLPKRFMVIEQAMGAPMSRGAEAGAVLAAFVEEMKAEGFVADALARHRISGASVAPGA